MSKHKDSTLCPLPWKQLSINTDTKLRICCNSGPDGFAKKDNGEYLFVHDLADEDAFYKSKWMKSIRDNMLAGKWPKECIRCEEVENAGGYSIRQAICEEEDLRGDWISEIKARPETTNINSIDMGLTNNCNIKCVMCAPIYSYDLKEEYDKFDLWYDTEFTHNANTMWEHGKTLEFIQNIVSDNKIENLLTTGGEPFFSKKHLEILDIIINSNQASNILLRYHTNGTLINKKLFKKWEEFKVVDVHFSIDGVEELNSYIRYGTDWEKLNKTVDYIQDIANVYSEVHTTVTAFTIFDLPKLYQWILTKNFKYKLPVHIWVDSPNWARLSLLDKDSLYKAKNNLESYFDVNKSVYEDEISQTRMKQILSFLDRAISEGQNLDHLEESRIVMKQLEKNRGMKPIESIVPAFKNIYRISTVKE